MISVGIEEFCTKYGDKEMVTKLIEANGAIEVLSSNLAKMIDQLTKLVNYNGMVLSSQK